MFGGHALFTISDKTFDRMVDANNGRVGFHIHVSKGMNDVYDSLQNYGRRPDQRLQDHGILGPKTILGHCIHVNAAEMDIIRATDTMCVNNPESNMGNAVGISPVLQLYKKGILIGKGGSALKRVGTQARLEMEDFFQKKVFLQLFVKVNPDWRENRKELRKFGYEE